MSAKRHIPNEFDVLISPNQPPQKTTKIGDSELRITLLGAGQEVGRSCCLIEYKGKRIVCDAGVHPAYTGLAALPFIDELDWSTVDALLITHFHLDHAAALTYIMEKTNFKEGNGKVYMTSPTKAVYRFMMQDFVRISTTSAEDQLFTETEMIASWRSIQVSDFNQEIVPASGVRFTPYPAGHVLGAAMFLIEIAGLKVLYTGDYSREEDRHLHAAEIPKEQTDVLIVESTYGVQTLENRPEKEKRFTELVHSIIRRGGRVLMPSFALGRAQELLLILDEYWQRNPDLHSIPIYYASNLARKCMAVYQAYIRTMNKNINRRFDSGENPFQFKFISELGDLRKWQDKGPCVMLASPGMLQSGTSRELLERWAPDPKNGLIICGYSVEGTMAHSIVNEPDEIIGVNGNKIPRKLSVDYISFSAHVDFTQNTQFIDEIKPQHVVLVHGALMNMSRLAAALRSRYADRGLDIKVHMPKNAEPLRLEFKPEMTAKAIGKLAEKQPAEGEVVQGLLVNKDFTYTLLDRADLKDFAGLATNTIIQQQKVNLSVGWELIRWHLQGMYGSVDEGFDNDGLRTIRIMDTVDIKQAEENNVLLEWKAGAMNDAIADSVLALTLSVETSPVSVKMTSTPCVHAHEHSKEEAVEDVKEFAMKLDKIVALLDAHFGEINHEEVDNQHKLIINVDDNEVKINVETMHVESPDESLKERVESVLAIAIMTVTPLSAVKCSSAEESKPKDIVKVEKPSVPHFEEPTTFLDGYKVLSQRRIVALGDLHGDYQRTIEALKLADIIDEDNHWDGSKATLVQTGDITDRGSDMIPIYQLFESLRVEAARAGGSVHTILGNHDIMQPMDDWRYVHPKEMKYFDDSIKKRQQVFSNQGWIGKAWLQNYDTTVNIPHFFEADVQKYGLPSNMSTQFVHAGLHPSYAHNELNEDGKIWLKKLTSGDKNWSRKEKLLWKPDGPYWYRGAALDSETKACAIAKEVMQAVGAKRIVQGHTPNYDGIVSRCNGGILLIDTGMSRAYGGVASALEINGYVLSKDEKIYYREVVRALYQNEKETLVDETHSV
ncbi:hypothetical protein E3P91_02008 [Wallemia ichthyophaga]|nr:hypothetical protein E3P91_02008 [Wallemia ichthyophaga]